MKIVIPTNNKKGLSDTVAEHFGRCDTYTFLDENGNIIEIIANTSEHMGGTGLPPELMKKRGANILLCKELGTRALNLCKQLEIAVYVCQAKTVKEIFEMWKNNKIKKANLNDVCEEHKLG
ncbi:dinitrogenase iron-molybdenum cofactor biosynthesis protein [Patescibacteria group bacterium]|nr:dinitrogenase iron-molybdenum cofactor biosynthesis protein [Patescibacteria group bacterium]